MRFVVYYARDQIRRENARLRRAVEELALLNELAREIGGHGGAPITLYRLV